MRRRNRNPRCAVNVATEAIGDPWSLLVIRDIVYHGKHTFGEFMASEERITTNVLADRLCRLVESGILTRECDPDDRRREGYELTEKGLDLIPILVDLGTWGAKYGAEVRAYPEWLHAAEIDPGRLYRIVRHAVVAGGSALRGANSALEQLRSNRTT